MSEYNQPPPAGAPEPPYYQQPEPRSGMPTWAIVLLIVGGLFVVVCVVGGIVTIGILTMLGNQVSTVFSEINSGLEDMPITEAVDTSAALSTGETADLSALRITLIEARLLTEFSGDRKPPPGKQYWSVEVEVENSSDIVQTVSAFTTLLQDETGAIYRYSTVAQRASPNPGLRVSETVRPSQKLRGLLFYEVPEGVERLFWVYSDLLYGEPVVFEVHR